MKDKVRWGILSTGGIAKTLARALATLPDAELVAVGSRTKKNADAFGDEFNVPHRHGSYEELAADADVDVVYVATPHSFHHRDTLLCLEAGRGVLCEKAFCINAREAEEMIRLARKKNLFLMEAMWARFLPVTAKVRQWVAEGAIGDVYTFTADFSFNVEFNPHGRMYNLELGGGAMLDLGIYPIAYASMVFGGGAPSKIASAMELGETGCDVQTAAILDYGDARFAIVHAGFKAGSPQEAHILGSRGRIVVDPTFLCANSATLYAGRRTEQFEISGDEHQHAHEAAEVMRCLREGKLESELMPLDETLTIMRTMDAIREPWGLTYPNDRPAAKGKKNRS